MPLRMAFMRQRQAVLCELQASLDVYSKLQAYIVRAHLKNKENL